MTGKQLKNSILQWAIQGKLVPQDPNDEPASVLLEKIRAEKARLIKEGKIKKDKKESIIYRGEDNSYYEKFADGKVICIDDEIPFEVPKGWEWCRMGAIGDWGAGATPAKGNPNYYGGNILWLRTGELNNDVVYDTEINVTNKALKECSLRLNKIGDVMIAMYGATIGKVAIAGTEMTTNQACCACTPIGIFNWYLFYFLMGSQIDFVKKGEGGAQPNISREKLIAHIMPVPPLTEQHKIVGKIKEILPLVEKYTHSQAQQNKLNDSIKTLLRKSILQEAIQGKLVPQTPNDEPASVLLQRIKEEKQRLFKEGKLKKKDIIDSTIFRDDDNKYYEQIGKSITEITEEIPFRIPDSWTWSRLSVVVKIIMGQSPDGNDVFEAEKEDNAYEFHQGKIYFTEKYISPSGKWCKNPPRIANIGSLLVCVRAPIGDVNIVQRQIGIGRGLAAIIGYAKITTDFLYYWILAHKKNLIEKGTGSTFKAITLDVLKKMIIPIPPLAEQKRILSRIELLYDKIESN